jgi:hypothetical protein
MRIGMNAILLAMLLQTDPSARLQTGELSPPPVLGPEMLELTQPAPAVREHPGVEHLKSGGKVALAGAGVIGAGVLVFSWGAPVPQGRCGGGIGSICIPNEFVYGSLIAVAGAGLVLGGVALSVYGLFEYLGADESAQLTFTGNSLSLAARF